MAGPHTAEHDCDANVPCVRKHRSAAETGLAQPLQSVKTNPAESAETAEARFTLVNAVRVAGPDRIIFWGKRSLVVGSWLLALEVPATIPFPIECSPTVRLSSFVTSSIGGPLCVLCGLSLRTLRLKAFEVEMRIGE